jgi:hypothetical protein
MPTLTGEACTLLWDIACTESKNPDLMEVRYDKTSPLGKSFLFYTIDGEEERYMTLMGEDVSKIEGLIISTREQFFEEKELYNVKKQTLVPGFSVRKIGSFYVCVKSENLKNEFNPEEQIFISPYGKVVLEWLKKYNKDNKKRLAGLQGGMGDGKRFMPICDELNETISESERQMKQIKHDFKI